MLIAVKLVRLAGWLLLLRAVGKWFGSTVTIQLGHRVKILRAPDSASVGYVVWLALGLVFACFVAPNQAMAQSCTGNDVSYPSSYYIDINSESCSVSQGGNMSGNIEINPQGNFFTIYAEHSTTLTSFSCPGASTEAFDEPTTIKADANMGSLGNSCMMSLVLVNGGRQFNITLRAVYDANLWVVVFDNFAMTVMDAPVGPTGPTESELLVQQQDTFTPLIMNQQSHDLVTGVGENLRGRMNGNGLAPVMTTSSFAMSTTGRPVWMANRRLAGERKAFDLFDDGNEFAPQAPRPKRIAADKTTGAARVDLAVIGDRIATTDRIEPVILDNSFAFAADATLDELAEVAPALPTWNAWIKGSWTLYEGDGSSFDGHVTNVMGGVDYRVREDLIVGVLAGYGIAEFDTVTGSTAGSFDAEGYTVGAYLGHRITPELTLDGLVAYTASEYDNRAGATAGAFDADRITAAGHLKGRIEWGVATIEPTLSVMWASEHQDAYTDSAAVAHPAQTVTAGRVSLGPRISFQPVSTGVGEVAVWLAAMGEYDFSNRGGSATSGLPDINDVFSGRVQVGVNAVSDNGIRLALQGDVSGLGSGEFTAYGATIKMTIPLP